MKRRPPELPDKQDPSPALCERRSGVMSRKSSRRESVGQLRLWEPELRQSASFFSQALLLGGAAHATLPERTLAFERPRAQGKVAVVRCGACVFVTLALQYRAFPQKSRPVAFKAILNKQQSPDDLSRGLPGDP